MRKALKSLVLAGMVLACQVPVATAATPSAMVQTAIRDHETPTEPLDWASEGAVQQPWDMPSDGYDPNGRPLPQRFAERGAARAGAAIGAAFGGSLGFTLFGPPGAVVGGVIGTLVGEVFFEWAAANMFNRGRYMPQANPPYIPSP